MSLINDFIAGNPACSSIDWHKQISENKLGNTVKKVMLGDKERYVIDLQNSHLTSPFGVVSLIKQLYGKKCYDFDLKNFNCNKEEWHKLFNQLVKAFRDDDDDDDDRPTISMNVHVETSLRDYVTALAKDAIKRTYSLLNVQTNVKTEQSSNVVTVRNSTFKCINDDALMCHEKLNPDDLVEIQDDLVDLMPKKKKCKMSPSANDDALMCHENLNPDDLVEIQDDLVDLMPKKKKCKMSPSAVIASQTAAITPLHGFENRVVQLMEQNGEFANAIGKYTLSTEETEETLTIRMCDIVFGKHMTEKVDVFQSIFAGLSRSMIDELLIRDLALNGGEHSKKLIDVIMKQSNFMMLDFVNCPMDESVFVQMSQNENNYLDTIEIDSPISGTTWPAKIPELVRNCPSLNKFYYYSVSEVDSLHFLNEIFALNTGLSTLCLTGLRFAPSTLLLAILDLDMTNIKAGASFGKNGEEDGEPGLSVTFHIPLDRFIDGNLILINETLELINSTFAGRIKISVDVLEKKPGGTITVLPIGIVAESMS